MALFLNLVLFLLLSISVDDASKILIDSMIITQVRDPETPDENSNAYIVTSTRSREGFMVDPGVTTNITSELLAALSATSSVY